MASYTKLTNHMREMTRINKNVLKNKKRAEEMTKKKNLNKKQSKEESPN